MWILVTSVICRLVTFAVSLDRVPDDVARSAQMPGLAFDLDHRRRGLGRDASRLPPNEFVEHQIADCDDPQVGEFTDDLLSA